MVSAKSGRRPEKGARAFQEVLGLLSVSGGFGLLACSEVPRSGRTREPSAGLGCRIWSLGLRL